jgi:hypothetical protein
LIIRTKAREVPSNHILECLELRITLGNTDQLDARRRGFKITCPKLELSERPKQILSARDWLQSIKSAT